MRCEWRKLNRRWRVEREGEQRGRDKRGRRSALQASITACAQFLAFSRHDATTKWVEILRKAKINRRRIVDSSSELAASSPPPLTSAFCIIILNYSLHRRRRRHPRLPPSLQHNSGWIMLHQGELWESGHVTKRERERTLNALPPSSLLAAKERPSARAS